MVILMKLTRSFRTLLKTAILTILAGSSSCALIAEPAAGASQYFQQYAARTEARLAIERHAVHMVLPAELAGNTARLRQGEVVIEKLTPATEVEQNGAMLYHWRGTAFAPGAKGADFERVMKNFESYPRIFSPQVLRMVVQSRQGDSTQLTMRVEQKHVLTVVMDISYSSLFGRVSPVRGFSLSRSTSVHEIENAGRSSEHVLGHADEHGFLWRQNTYWSWEERDGGLVVQVESVTLSRAIPTGLGWAIRPFVETVPRESLEFTLRSTANALRR